MKQTAFVTRATLKAIMAMQTRSPGPDMRFIKYGVKTLVPKEISIWNIMKTFADQLARDHENNVIGATKVSPATMLMYRLFVMMLRQCWKLAGICKVDIDILKQKKFKLEYYRTVQKRNMDFK
jgi:hypothetical protein